MALHCFPLVSLALYFHLSLSHHVVFEEIGKMAGMLSHIHAIVPVNISGLTRAIIKFQKDVLQFQEKYKHLKQPIGTHFNFDEHFHSHIYNLLDLSTTNTDDMLQTIVSLQSSLPQVAVGPHQPLSSAQEFQIKKWSPFTIVTGIFGTLMGWFTPQCLNSLKDQLSEVQDQQNCLSQIQTIQLHCIEEIKSAVCTITRALETGHSAWLNYRSLD